MRTQGLAPNRLTNIWVPFVVAAAAALRPKGRLALVVPAELLQVTYAAQLRTFLTNRFRHIHLIACNELFFANAEQEVLLLLAEGARTTPALRNDCQLTLTEAPSITDILNRSPRSPERRTAPMATQDAGEKWLQYFLTDTEIGFLRDLRTSGAAVPLGRYASVRVGVVTGKNKYFVLRRSEVTAHGLCGHAVPLVSRTIHLLGTQFDHADWQTLSDQDHLVHLLHLAPLEPHEPPPPLERYIRLGEVQNIHRGYKCSIREPWYVVPSVWSPDAFLFRQIYDFPRMVLNRAAVTCTDTIHRVRCTIDPEAVLTNTYTSLVAASSEIEGRSYGGGVLELEPKEAQRVLMPAALGDALPLQECDQLVRRNRLRDLLDENDRLVLRNAMGLSPTDCQTLRRIWERMRNRRHTRRPTRSLPSL